MSDICLFILCEGRTGQIVPQLVKKTLPHRCGGSVYCLYKTRKQLSIISELFFIILTKFRDELSRAVTHNKSPITNFFVTELFFIILTKFRDELSHAVTHNKTRKQLSVISELFFIILTKFRDELSRAVTHLLRNCDSFGEDVACTFLKECSINKSLNSSAVENCDC